MNTYPTVDLLIPHQPPMRLVERVVDEIEDGLVVMARVDASAWYADNEGFMPAWIGIELMAQSISAWAGLYASRAGLPPLKGFLIGTREYRSYSPRFTAGEELFIEVRKIFYESGGLAAFDCLIRNSSITLAEATLKVYNTQSYENVLDPSGENT